MNLAANCVGLWKMNDNLLNKAVKDYSGKGNDGMARQVTSVLHTDGKIDGALIHNGADDFIDCRDKPDYDFTTALSVAMWVRADTIEESETFISKYKSSDSADREWYFPVAGIIGEIGELRVIFGNPANGTYVAYQRTVDRVFSTEVWHLIGFVYNGALAAADRCKIYMDGVEKASITADGVVPASLYNGIAKLAIGANDDGRVNFFDGDIDVTMIFNKALSDANWTFLWNEGNGREALAIVPIAIHHYKQAGGL